MKLYFLHFFLGFCSSYLSNSYQINKAIKFVPLKKFSALHGAETNEVPTNTREDYGRRGKKLAAGLGIMSALLLPRRKSLAVGDLYQLKDQRMVLKDVSFNVPNTYAEQDGLSSLFQGTLQSIRTQSFGNQNKTVMAFGPDTLSNPPTFYPGVSSFQEDGGHATLTLKSSKLQIDGLTEVYEKGNGLQYIKIGNDVLRLSKGIEKGANIKFAYGWVDLDSPSGIPLEIVVGIARDPIMLACLLVSDIKASTAFFKDNLGMREQPFPLSRVAGSDYEPAQPKSSIYLGYGPDSMGVLLVPAAKNSRVVVGSQLDAFTIVVDDSDAVSVTDMPPLPLPVQAALTSTDGSQRSLYSPDGYKFVLLPYSEFKKSATVSVPSGFIIPPPTIE